MKAYYLVFSSIFLIVCLFSSVRFSSVFSCIFSTAVCFYELEDDLSSLSSLGEIEDLDSYEWFLPSLSDLSESESEYSDCFELSDFEDQVEFLNNDTFSVSDNSLCNAESPRPKKRTKLS